MKILLIFIFYQYFIHLFSSMYNTANQARASRKNFGDAQILVSPQNLKSRTKSASAEFALLGQCGVRYGQKARATQVHFDFMSMALPRLGQSVRLLRSQYIFELSSIDKQFGSLNNL